MSKIRQQRNKGCPPDWKVGDPVSRTFQINLRARKRMQQMSVGRVRPEHPISFRKPGGTLLPPWYEPIKGDLFTPEEHAKKIVDK